MLKDKLFIIESLSAELKKCTNRDWLIHFSDDDIIVEVYYPDCGTYRTTYGRALNSIIVNEDYTKMLAHTILAGLYLYKLTCQISKKDVDNYMDVW